MTIKDVSNGLLTSWLSNSISKVYEQLNNHAKVNKIKLTGNIPVNVFENVDFKHGLIIEDYNSDDDLIFKNCSVEKITLLRPLKLKNLEFLSHKSNLTIIHSLENYTPDNPLTIQLNSFNYNFNLESDNNHLIIKRHINLKIYDSNIKDFTPKSVRYNFLTFENSNFESILSLHCNGDKTNDTQVLIKNCKFNKSLDLTSSLECDMIHLENLEFNGNHEGIFLTLKEYSKHRINFSNVNTPSLQVTTHNEQHGSNSKIRIYNNSNINALRLFSLKTDSIDLTDSRVSYISLEHNLNTILRIKDLTEPINRFVTNELICSGIFAMENITISKEFKFSGAKLLNRTYFDRVIFNCPPEFHGSEIYTDTRFKDCKFNCLNEDSVGAYRVLKELMIGVHNHIEELQFSSLELHANWNVTDWKKDLPVFIFGGIYKLSNNFGRSVVLPILWLVNFTVYFYLIYDYFGKVYLDASKTENHWHKTIELYGQNAKNIGFSVINSLGPLKLHPSLSAFYSGDLTTLIASTVHSLLSSYFLFLIFTWVRRRFKTH